MANCLEVEDLPPSLYQPSLKINQHCCMPFTYYCCTIEKNVLRGIIIKIYYKRQLTSVLLNLGLRKNIIIMHRAVRTSRRLPEFRSLLYVPQTATFILKI